MARSSYRSLKPFKGGARRAVDENKSYDEIKKSLKTQRVDFGVDEKYIKSFYDDLKTYKTDAENDYDGISYGSDVNSLYDKHSSATSSLRERADNIRAYLNANKKNINQDTYGALLSDLDSFDTFFNDTSKAFEKQKDFYSTFATKNDYDAYVMNNTSGTDGESVHARKDAYDSIVLRIAELDKEIKDTGYEGRTTHTMSASGLLVPVNYSDKETTDRYNSLVEERDKLQAELRKYEHSNKKTDELYSLYSENEDWAEDSKSRNLNRPNERDLARYGTINIETGEVYDIEESAVTMEDPLGTYFAFLNGEDGHFYGSVTDVGITPETNKKTNASNHIYEYNEAIRNGRENHWELFEPEEIDLYYYMMNNDLKEEALAYLDGMQVVLDRRATEKMQQGLEDANLLELAFHNAVSVPASIIGGATAFVDDAFNMMVGNDINPYSGGHAIQNYAHGARTAMANDIDRWTGASADDWLTWGDAYQGIMSGIDSAVGAVTLGSGYTVLMGMGAASSEAKELYEKGASKAQIIGGSLLAGAAEAVFEKVSVGHFLDKVLNAPSKNVGKWALKTLGMAGVEASEEFATTIANYISDAAVRGNTSDWNAVINKYKKRGHTDGSAIWEAVKEIGGEALHDAAVGAISGGFAGGVGGAVSSIPYANALKHHGQQIIDNGGVDTLKTIALQDADNMGGKEGKVLAKQANAVSSDVVEGKGLGKITAYVKNNSNVKAVGELSYAVNDARIQQNKADIIKELEGKGVSEKKAAKYADILFEMNEEFFSGKESAFTLGTDEQWKKITGDENAYSVLRNIITDEKSPVNIRNLRYGLSRNGIRVDGDGNVNQEDVENYYTRQMVRAAGEGLITPVKNEFDVSENGKTQITESGETVKKRTFVDGADGTLRLRVNDSTTVDVGDVSFADEGEAIVFSAIVSMGMDAEAANEVLPLYKGKGKKAGSRFAYGINLAFNAGKINRSLKILQTIHSLTAQQADAVYKLGRQYAQKSAQKAQERVDAKKKKTTSTNRGEVVYEGDLADENGNLAVKESELNGMQQASLSGIRLLAEISNIRFHIYRSEKMISKDGGEEFRYIAPNGESVTANGFYITGTNDIYIDLNAGNNGEGTMMYTAAHEIMHFIKDFSPAKFQQIADFLMEEYAKRNVNVKKLLDKQIEIVKRSVENRSDSEKPSEQEIHDMAFEEMVCDAMSGMLIDGSFADSMAKLRQTNKGLWQTIADAVAKLLEKWGIVVNAYNNKQMDSQEARLVAQMDAAFRKLQQMFAEGMVDAGAAYAQMEKTGSEKYSRRNGFNAEDVIKYSDRNNGKNLVKSKKSRYNEFATLAMQWANSNSTQIGDAKTIYDGKRKKYVLIEATDDGFVEVTAYTRKEYERYYGRVNRSGVGFSESSVEVQNDKGGHRAYDVRVEDAGVNGKNDTFLETQRIPVRSENDKQGNRADYQGEFVKTSQRTNGKVLYQERSTALLEKENTRTDYAPVFYSKLERVVDDMKDQKLGADSVIGYLKGRGIKDEEIKHLGIRELLKGKKSVTKLELKKAIVENKPRIEEVVLTDDPNASEENRARHSDAALLGGANYRDVLFLLPYEENYLNLTMSGHWDTRYTNVLAHTRIQDFTDVYGKRLLFIEEIQSDWHNAHKHNVDYGLPPSKKLRGIMHRIGEFNKKRRNLEGRLENLSDTDPRSRVILDELEKVERDFWKYKMQNDVYKELENASPPSDLFSDTYHEYILKRLIRMAAEEGYDSLAWTPAKVQVARWDKDFEGAFHILYDQNMPGFLKKYGKQWGATVGKTTINAEIEVDNDEDIIEESLYEELTSGTIDVWCMDITDSMRDSALYEGQMMFQERDKSAASSPVYDEQAYKEIIRKSDMPITQVGGFVPKNRADTVVYAKQKAAKIGRFNKDGSVSVYVNDLDKEVLLGTDGLKYGLHPTKDMRKDANYIVTLYVGEILRNAVRIDELFTDDAMDDQYVLLGVAANDKDQLHIVRFIVNRPENELASIEVLATEDRAVFELLGSSDSRSSIPVSALLEYIGIGKATEEHNFVKIKEGDVNAQNADIDKHIQRRDNISRANNEGDFINEFHKALSSTEWSAFYKGLAQDGHLQNTRVGTIATVVIGNKLVIAERQYMKEEVHDYVVCDVFRIENYTGSNFVLHLIKEAIEEGDLNYDSRTSYKFIHQFLERNFSTELLARYDGDSLQFVVDSTQKSKFSNTGKVY